MNERICELVADNDRMKHEERKNWEINKEYLDQIAEMGEENLEKMLK